MGVITTVITTIPITPCLTATTLTLMEISTMLPLTVDKAMCTITTLMITMVITTIPITPCPTATTHTMISIRTWLMIMITMVTITEGSSSRHKHTERHFPFQTLAVAIIPSPAFLFYSSYS